MVTTVSPTDLGGIASPPGSEVVEPPSLSRLARLGLPHGKQQILQRTLLYVPWRLFLRAQVAFNKAAAKTLTALTQKSLRLESKLAKLDSKTDAIATSANAAASAVREQLYDTEGELRRTLSDIQIQLARLEQRIGRS